MRLLIIALSLAFTLLSPSANAVLGVGDIVFDASNFGQNAMTAARTLQSNLHEAQALFNQAVQLENEARNLVRFPLDYWNRIETNYQQLKLLAQGNASIGEYLQRVNSQFNSIYPGYQSIENYGGAVKNWTDNALKTAESVIKTANEQRKLFDSTASQTQAIVAQGATSEGGMQALQTQVSLSGQVVSELQKLQQMQAEESSMRAAYIAGQVQDKAAERKATEDWLKKPYKPFL